MHMSFFTNSQDLFFYDVLSSDVVSRIMWPTHMLQPWNFFVRKTQDVLGID